MTDEERTLSALRGGPLSRHQLAVILGRDELWTMRLLKSLRQSGLIELNGWGGYQRASEGPQGGAA